MNPNAIAPGDNPAKLTNANVGAGYRLVTSFPVQNTPENFVFALDERAATIPEVLTKHYGWRTASWDEVDWAKNEVDGSQSVLTDDGLDVAIPISFRVPVTAAFIAWKAKQRPERAKAKEHRDRRIATARAFIVAADKDFDKARRDAFADTAAEYGYVPFSTHGFESIQFNRYPDKTTLVFPPLPAGVKWANRDNMTPEQFGVDEGWRPLCSLDTKWPDDNEFYSSALGEWVCGGPGSTNPCDYIFQPKLLNTYRTKAPIPQPKPLQFPPLPPGASWILPDNLSPEEIGVSEGWRPICSLDEKYPWDTEKWDNVAGWISTSLRGAPLIRGTGVTRRTKAPIPTA